MITHPFIYYPALLLVNLIIPIIALWEHQQINADYKTRKAFLKHKFNEYVLHKYIEHIHYAISPELLIGKCIYTFEARGGYSIHVDIKFEFVRLNKTIELHYTDSTYPDTFIVKSDTVFLSIVPQMNTKEIFQQYRKTRRVIGQINAVRKKLNLTEVFDIFDEEKVQELKQREAREQEQEEEEQPIIYHDGEPIPKGYEVVTLPNMFQKVLVKRKGEK